MKLYIVSESENGISNIDGNYYLMTEYGEVIEKCKASSLFFARLNLYEHNEKIKELCDKKYEDYTIHFLKFATTTDAIRNKLAEFKNK